MRVLFHRRFIKHYRKCDQKQQIQVDQRIDIFVRDPHAPILRKHSLTGRHKGKQTIDITGDLRALYVYCSEDDTAVFVELDTHSNLYG